MRNGLPSPRQNWTVRRKAAVVKAVREGAVPVEDILDRYHMSIEEFYAWERDIDRHGVPGLRSTRVQIYRTGARKPKNHKDSDEPQSA